MTREKEGATPKTPPDGGGDEQVNDLFKGGEVEAAAAKVNEVRAGKKITITVYNSDGPNGDKPVFVACNGYGMSIPRNQPVDIPEGIYGALKDAVEVQYYRDVDDEGKQFGPIKSREVPRFPFSVHV